MAALLASALYGAMFGFAPGNVAHAQADAHCDPSDTNEIWCATVTAGTDTFAGIDAYGYFDSYFDGTAYGSPDGSLSDTTFEFNSVTYTVGALFFEPDKSPPAATLTLLPGSATALRNNRLRLQLGTKSFSMGDAAITQSHSNGLDLGFNNPGLSWSDGDTIPVKLVVNNNPATGKPTISGAGRVRQILTAEKGTIADTDGVGKSFR